MTPKRETISPDEIPAHGVLSSDDDGHGNYLAQKRDSGPTIIQKQGRLALSSSRKPMSDINVTGHTSHLDSKVQFTQIRNGQTGNEPLSNELHLALTNENMTEFGIDQSNFRTSERVAGDDAVVNLVSKEGKYHQVSQRQFQKLQQEMANQQAQYIVLAEPN